MESFVFVDRALFTSYIYVPLRDPSDATGEDHPVFQINLDALIETLNILTLADLPVPKQSATTEAYAAHRLNRHAGMNAFSSTALGMNGNCTLTYASEGSPLSINMSDAGVTTTCDLTTYSPETLEEIPFSREAIALKTIMPSSCLLDAISELSSLNPAHVTISALPDSSAGKKLSLLAVGALGSATVDFATDPAFDTPTLETFQCPAKTSASFRFALIKSAQRAMATSSKVSLRLDEDGVLSMQYLVQLERYGRNEGVAFVDFRVVPLVEGEADEEGDDSAETDDE